MPGFGSATVVGNRGREQTAQPAAETLHLSKLGRSLNGAEREALHRLFRIFARPQAPLEEGQHLTMILY